MFGRTGRFGWPTVLQYRTRDGKLHMCPPVDDSPWREVVYNRDARRQLWMCGDLTSKIHTGIENKPPIDNGPLAANERRRKP